MLLGHCTEWQFNCTSRRQLNYGLQCSSGWTHW